MRCAHFLLLPRQFLHRPDGMLHAPLFALQGGGLYIQGTATLTNTNVYSNEVQFVSVCILNRLRHFLHRPIELTLELTDCCARARDFGTAVCECLHFEPSLTCPPSPLTFDRPYMELDLTFAARRAVASMLLAGIC